MRSEPTPATVLRPLGPLPTLDQLFGSGAGFYPFEAGPAQASFEIINMTFGNGQCYKACVATSRPAELQILAVTKTAATSHV